MSKSLIPFGDIFLANSVTNSDFLIPTSIVQIMKLNESNSLSLEYQRCTPSACKDIGIRQFEFVAKTQFLFNGKFSKISRIAIYIVRTLELLEL